MTLNRLLEKIRLFWLLSEYGPFPSHDIEVSIDLVKLGDEDNSGQRLKKCARIHARVFDVGWLYRVDGEVKSVELLMNDEISRILATICKEGKAPVKDILSK